MSKRKRSISLMVYLYAALAIIAVAVVVVGWMASDQFGQYIETVSYTHLRAHETS